MECRSRTTRTWIIAILDVPSWIRRVIRRRALVTSDLTVIDTACRELHEDAVAGRVVQMVVEPPFVKCEVH